MKKELLSPAGNIEAAYAAINNGADAVYLSGKSFGARSFADNFSNEELLEIISHAHLLGVKIYVTLNTLISDEKMEEAIEFAEFLHRSNVDAVIVQDFGFAKVLKETFPNLVLHASTQMHNLDSNSIVFLKELGFKRVVLAREVSIDDINSIQTDLEIEAFIHGSLCISYSGECLISSMAMNRSGNLGSCSQLCRMPYSLEINGTSCPKSGKYLLSPKDLATFSNFDKIMESNIVSLKIEGRMKSKEYVGLVTSIYRKLIDAYYDSKKVDITKELEMLNYLFNRGYTEGHILNDENIMNIKRGNHKGVNIGKVLSFDDKYITLKLTEDLKIKDGIKFEESDKGLTVYNLYKNRVEVKSAKSGDIVSVLNNIKLDTLDNVLKTYDDLINEELSVFDAKKIDININVEAILNKPLKVVFSDGINEVVEYGSNVEASLNKEITKEDIISKISKTGNTVYKANIINIEKSDNIFIRLTEINEIRRNLIEKLNEKRLSTNINFVKKDYNLNTNYVSKNRSLAVYVRNKSQLEIIKSYPVDKIYTDNYDLMSSNEDLNMYYEIFMGDENINFTKLLVNSTSDIIKYKDNDLVINYGLNVYNSENLNYLSNYGVPVYSVELSLSEIGKINKKIINKGELLIYGKPRVMMMNHCLLFNKRDCANCKYSNVVKDLKDAFNRTYKVLCRNKINYIYNHKTILKIRDLSDFIRLGVTDYRIDFFDESEYEIRKILNEYFL